ncbi:MAG: metal-dependent transcriptional regulator [Deltaproteobacteria bacterium]|nr:metal-dependent transcriptional regulator [Deltaproteobacteria bacterium]
MAPSSTAAVPALSDALEDYLEAIYVLLRDQPYARVRDIAKARGVKTGSVIPALRRLSDAGLVDYRQREYVNLTESGQVAARRVFSRHQILLRFFTEVLQMPAELAEQDACSMEHGLSDEGLDRLVRFMEFLRVCPNSQDEFLSVFHNCSLAGDVQTSCTGECRIGPAAGSSSTASDGARKRREIPQVSIHDLRPGQTGTVTHVNARGSIRQRLLDMGVLPDASVELVRVAPTGNPIWIKMEGTQLALRQDEAKAVLVEKS